MYLFYTPNITEPDYLLNEEESAHCIRVLRKRAGDIIQTIDGKGGFYKAEITGTDPKKCTIKIIGSVKEHGKRDFYLHLAVAPTKNIERFEWFLEKATEIGIDEITPIRCEHSERTIVKTERLNKVVITAIKQSLKAYLPKLNEMVSYDAFIKKQFMGGKYIAHCHAPLSSGRGAGLAFGKPLATEGGEVPHLKTAYTPTQPALVLIGPEGDFSKEEVEAAIKHGFKEISLGKNRLRTETAAVVACHAINLAND